MVAEKVMGWEVSEFGQCFISGRISPVHSELPPFATDAGLALEAAMKAGDRWPVSTMPLDANDYYVEIRHGLLKRWPNGRARTVARALCLAALRAAGVQVEDDAENEGRGEME